jgi:hypothetical protein
MIKSIALYSRGKFVCERRAESGEQRPKSGELNLRHELRGKNAPITAGFTENIKVFLENLKV